MSGSAFPAGQTPPAPTGTLSPIPAGALTPPAAVAAVGVPPNVHVTAAPSVITPGSFDVAAGSQPTGNVPVPAIVQPGQAVAAG